MNVSDRESPLLESFLQLVMDQGVQNVTLEKIASAAGVSFGKVHYYFGNDRDKLYLKAVAFVSLKARDFIENYLINAPAGSNPLKRYAQGSFAWAEALPSHAAFWSYYYHLAGSMVAFREGHANYLRIARARLRSLVAEAVGLGFYPPPQDADGLAMAIHNQIVGGMIIAFTDPAPEAVAHHRDLTIEVIDRILRSVPTM